MRNTGTVLPSSPKSSNNKQSQSHGTVQLSPRATSHPSPFMKKSVTIITPPSKSRLGSSLKPTPHHDLSQNLVRLINRPAMISSDQDFDVDDFNNYLVLTSNEVAPFKCPVNSVSIAFQHEEGYRTTRSTSPIQSPLVLGYLNGAPLSDLLIADNGPLGNSDNTGTTNISGGTSDMVKLVEAISSIVNHSSHSRSTTKPLSRASSKASLGSKTKEHGHRRTNRGAILDTTIDLIRNRIGEFSNVPPVMPISTTNASDQKVASIDDDIKWEEKLEVSFACCLTLIPMLYFNI